MKTYLTICEGWAQADIEAEDEEQAEEILKERIADLQVPWGTEIMSELEESDELSTLRD